MTFIGQPIKMGIDGFKELCIKVKQNFKHMYYEPNISESVHNFLKDCEVLYLTGIGSSESHARYLEQLMDNHPKIKAKFRPIMDFYSNNFEVGNSKIILFS